MCSKNKDTPIIINNVLKQNASDFSVAIFLSNL